MKKLDLIWGPGKYIVLMTYWWVLPFFFANIARYPVTLYDKSCITFYIAFIVTLITALILNILNASFSFWARFEHWAKIFLLTGSYAVNIFATLAVTLALDSYDLIECFGACPAGLYIPSVLAYFALATLVAIGIAVWKRLKKNMQ